MFITGLLGIGGLTSFGQFNGINGINGINQSNRPFFLGNQQQNNGYGTFGDTGFNGGYYKSDHKSVNFNEFATTEKEPQYVDQFYNYEKKVLQSKSEKQFDKEPKILDERSARANTYRNFVWQSD